MESILAFSLTQNVSDLHLSSGEKVIIRQNGQLKKVSENIFTHNELEIILFSILNDEQKQQLKKNKQLDFGYSHSKFGRFRGHIFYQNNGISAVFRVINSKILELSKLNVPEIVKKLAIKTQGLILITGATGSGKSTTLSAIIQFINQHYAKHIITLEDPIEFIHQNQRSVIQQREVGIHCADFMSGMISMLRQDPDIIVIGELRDKLTIETALRAAETGHLVFATLHTNSAISTINRIVDIFPEQTKAFIQAQLSESLQAILSQKLILLPSLERKAQFEVLINTPAVSNLIQQGKTKQLISLMQTGQQFGMQMIEDSLK